MRPYPSGVAALGWRFFEKTTVLLVEDSKFQKLTNERMLHKAGYTVLTAADGDEALRMAREKFLTLSCWTCSCPS
jgi:CheY-like chemotaxis protein